MASSRNAVETPSENGILNLLRTIKSSYDKESYNEVIEKVKTLTWLKQAPQTQELQFFYALFYYFSGNSHFLFNERYEA